MLRFFVLLLILANGVYFAWSRGYLLDAGFAPTLQSEPQRLQKQVRPEWVQVISTEEFKQVEAQVLVEKAAKECFQVGPFTEAELPALQSALAATFAVGTWQLEAIEVPARWIVYMGKFANQEALSKKRDELLARRITTVGLLNPELAPGLVLAAFASQVEAESELARLGERGIRTARVVQESQASQQTQLKLPAVTAELKQRLSDIKPALGGHQLKSCS